MFRRLCRNGHQIVRAVGFDDGPPTQTVTVGSRGFKASLVGVWFTGLRVVQVCFDAVQVDGLDITDVIIRLLSGKRTDVIFLSGVSFAGFNIVDAKRIFRTVHVPVIIVSRDKPDNSSVKRALRKHFEDWRIRWNYVRAVGKIHSFAPKAAEPSLYFEAVGISGVKAKSLIHSYCATSRVPEPIRVAGILAKGLVL